MASAARRRHRRLEGNGFCEEVEASRIWQRLVATRNGAGIWLTKSEPHAESDVHESGNADADRSVLWTKKLDARFSRWRPCREFWQARAQRLIARRTNGARWCNWRELMLTSS